MCFAILPALATAASAIGSVASAAAPIAGVVGAVGSIMGAQSAARGATQVAAYNAQVAQTEGAVATQQAEYSAGIAEAEARQARDAAGFEEAQRRERSRFLLADQRQRILASGLSLEGSPLDVLAFNAGQYELDALAARYEGASRAQSFETEAEARRYQGRIAQTRATQGAGVALLQGQTAAAGYRQRAIGTALSPDTWRAVGGTARTINSWMS